MIYIQLVSFVKEAPNAIMKIAAVELGPREIRLDPISPDPTQTRILNKLGLGPASRQGLDDWIIERILSKD